MLINVCGRTTSIISRRHADNDSIKSFLQTLALAFVHLLSHTNSAQLVIVVVHSCSTGTLLSCCKLVVIIIIMLSCYQFSYL